MDYQTVIATARLLGFRVFYFVECSGFVIAEPDGMATYWSKLPLELDHWWIRKKMAMKYGIENVWHGDEKYDASTNYPCVPFPVAAYMGLAGPYEQ